MVEGKWSPIGFGRCFAEVEADFVAGDRVGEAQDGGGVGWVGGREEPEAFPARARGGDEVNAVAADRQRAPIDKGGDFFFSGFDRKTGRISCTAEFLHWAQEAIGRAGFADRGAEVHEGRGVVAASGFWEECGSGFF